MKINLLKGSVTYGAVTIFSRITAVILIPILTRLLTPDEYGVLSMVLTIITLVNLVVTFEVSQAVTLFFTDQNRVDRNLYPSTAIQFSLVMYFFLLVVIAIFGEIIYRVVVAKNFGAAIFIEGALLLAANGIFFLIQNQLRLEFKTRWYAILTLGYVLLTSFGAIAGALYFNHPIEAVILGQTAGAAIIGIIGIVLLWERFRFRFNMSKLREMLKYSLPLVPSGFLLLGGQQAPKIILSIFGSLEDVGIYGLAYQIAGFSGLAVLGVQIAITPSILANHQDIETPKKLGRLFEIFATVALMFCSFLSVFSRELIMIFSVPSYAGAASLVPFLAFAISLISLYIFFPGKIIKGKSGAQLLASTGSFLIAVIAGLVLIKLDGVRGAALSALLSAATFFLIWSFISQKLYRLPVNWLKIVKAAVLSAAVCAVGIFCIPAGITFYSVALKCGLLLLFSGLIGWEYLNELRKHFLNKP